MAKFLDSSGNEVEAFTAEEFEAKKKEALEEYLREHPDQSESIKKAEADLAATQAKLKELEEGGSDAQKKRLREERDASEAKLKEVTETVQKEITSLKEAFFGGAKSKMLEKLSKGDAQLKAKIETEYAGFAGDATTEAEIQTRMEKAYTLATGNKPSPNFMDGMAGGGQRGLDQKPGGGATQESDNGKAMRKAFGITDEQATKFSADSAS